MFRRGRIRPSRGSSLMGMIMGIVFVIIGVTFVIPMAGPFGILWTLFALFTTVMSGYNAFSERGISSYEVDVDYRETPHVQSDDFDTKLRKLKKLRDDGIITEEEYEVKKQEVLKDKW